MKEKWARTRDATMELISTYESSQEIWNCRHMHYKYSNKRSMCHNRWGRHLTPARQNFNEKYMTTAIRYVTISRTLQRVLYEWTVMVPSFCEMDYQFLSCIMYVNVQCVLPSMFGEGDVPWVSFVFPFFSVNRIKCCKVSNAALCGTCLWQM